MPTTYAIPNGRTVFDATLYTGTTAYPQTVVNQLGFKPDLVWAKSRSNTYYNGLFDSNRSGYVWYSNTTDAQDNTEQITFNSNGFSTPNKAADFINANGATYVAWQWQAGQGTTSSNANGSITSTVSVNATAGFSIVTYTGNFSAATVGHGLGVTPQFFIIKNLTTAGYNTPVFHASLGSPSSWLALDSTIATQTSSTVFNNTNPTSSVFSIGAASNTNKSGDSFVAYCWAQVAGFSQFGSYTGNGSTDGPFVYTGFRPRWIMIKRTDAAYSWWINDSARDPYNVAGKDLAANLSDAESSDAPVQDFLSNGFKLRTSSYPGFNASGGTYIYAAFAENPFKYANAR